MAEVVLAIRTDSTGSVQSVNVVSAPRVEAELQGQIVRLVEPLVLPELPSYDGTLSFTFNHEPPEARPLSPVMAGVFAGVVVGVTALLLVLLQ